MRPGTRANRSTSTPPTSTRGSRTSPATRISPGTSFRNLVLERVLGIILPVFSIIALGWLYGRRAKPDMGWVNRISMNVLAPALIFSALASKDFDIYANGLLILGGIGIVLGSGLLAWPIARWLGV